MNNGEFTIVLILIVLCATVFFCHALLRLFLLIFRGDRPSSRRRGDRGQHYMSPGGYAVPEEPIPVVLAQDEEARGTEPDASKVTPPAYGLWRGSVVSLFGQERNPAMILANTCFSELTRIDCSGNATRRVRRELDRKRELDPDHRLMLRMTAWHTLWTRHHGRRHLRRMCLYHHILQNLDELDIILSRIPNGKGGHSRIYQQYGRR